MEHPSNQFGNQTPFLQALEAQSDFPLSFLRDEFKDHSVWAERARKKVFDLLHYAPAPVDPEPEVIETVDRGDHVREKITFRTTPQTRVPAYVLIPKNARFPAPAIVALHDHGAMYYWGKEKIVATEADSHPVMGPFKEQYYGGKSICDELVRQGYVVIAIDMFNWGERRTDFRTVSHFKERIPEEPGSVEFLRKHNQLSGEHNETQARAIFMTGCTWSGIMFWDDIRTVDYLLTRPEVDPNRIGCVGLSVGGFRSDHLVSLDPRIKVAVAVGWMMTYRDALPDHVWNTFGWMKSVPGLHRFMDLPDMMALAIPRPLLIIDGLQDGLFPRKGVENAYEKIGRAYAKAGLPDRFRPSTYDTPHEFNCDMQREAWEWIEKWI